MQNRQRGSGPPQRETGKIALMGKPKKMCTAKHQMDLERQAAIVAADEAHMGAPPPEVNLFEATLVIPGQHMIPQGLDDDTAFDDIRKKHRVWITRVQPNIFEIRSANIKRLQDAIKDMNWCIHDMRLSSENLTSLFLVQPPVSAQESALVTVKLNSRPRVVKVLGSGGDILPAVLDVFRQMQPSLIPSTDILRALGTNLRMRINLGRMEVRQKKRDLEKDMTYAEFTGMCAACSIHGGARLVSRMPDVRGVDRVVQLMQHCCLGIPDVEPIQVPRRCTVFLRVGDQELLATAQAPSDQQAWLQLSASRMIRREKWPRLNWTVAAPDMQLDWNLQVDAFESTTSIPAKLQGIMKRLHLEGREAPGISSLIPTLHPVLTGATDPEVDETVLKTSIRLPFRGTPYVVEISIFQAWPRMMTAQEPETWWGLEFYGSQWSEALNNVSPGERRKDWGDGLRNIWWGKDPSLEQRFHDFLEHVVTIQSALSCESLRETRRVTE